jgi:hypothetical protein
VAETVTITYDGPALETGEMPVRDLAPALIAFADAISEAHRLVAPAAALPGVSVTAVRRGSFTVDLIVSEPTILDQLTDLWAGDEASAAANAAQVVAVAVGSTVGGFKLIKLLHRRKIRRIDPDLPRSGWVRITFDDGRVLEVPTHSFDLAQVLSFRDAARHVVAPLERPGVTDMTIRQSDDMTVEITSTEVGAFEVPLPGQELIVDTTREAAVRLLALGFGENYKWRVSDGDQPIWVTIQDLTFLERVQTNQEAFTAGDVLRVRLHTRQFRTAEGLLNEHSIVEVLEHIPGPRQVPLPMSDDEDEIQPEG